MTLLRIRVVDKPFRCLRCNAILGETDGLAFRTREIKIEKMVKVTCLSCGASRTWYPARLTRRVI